LLLDAFVELRLRFPDLLLILVARHPERFGAVTRLSWRRGFRTLRRTELDSTLDARTQVVVGDTMGEMHRLYAAADLAFIGGSLVRHGGQNPLEACAVGVPVVFGPHMFNFEEITAMALERGAANQIRDCEELVAAVSLFFEHPDLRIAAGQAARSLIEQNHGSLANTMRVMERHALPAAESARDADRLRAADAASR
jgi:3-deoxy-D-manno-octulosonic-acid transferase